MREEIFKSYLEKLNSLCQSSELDDVSPTGGSGSKQFESVPFYVSENMNIETLSESDLYLTHTLLHTFYGRGGNKKLNKQTIEKLHSIVKQKIKHSDFDTLDRVK